MPRSSSFTCGPPAAPLWPRTGPAYASGTISGMQGDEGRAPDARRAGTTLSRRSRPSGEAFGSALGLALRRDLDLAAGDVLRHLLQLGLEVGGHLRVEVVERGEAGPVVLQGAHVGARGEGAGRGAVDVRRHGLGDVLDDAGEEHRAELRGADAPVGVDPQHAHLAVAGLGRGTGAEAGAAGDREDHVSAVLDELLTDRLALVLVGEALREGAVLLGLVPAEDLDVLA